MTDQQQAILLRIFIGEYDKYGRNPLYEEIVYAAKRAGLAGATVLNGVMSYGANSRIHKSKILAISEDLPMVVEIVDKPERIAEFLPILDAMIGEGLVTLERVRVIMYRHDASQSGLPGSP
jgi:PII-like signaling protein